MNQDDDDRRHRLAVIAAALGEEVASLRAAEERQTKALAAQSKDLAALQREVNRKNYRTTIKLRVLVGLVIMCVALSGAMVVGYIKFTELVDDQYVLRSQVLCPLYKIFVDSYNPNSVAAKAQGIEQYTATFDDIRHQYKALRCSPR